MRQITLTVPQNVLMNHIIQITLADTLNMCCDNVAITFCSESTQVCIKVFAGHRCHKSLFRTRIAAQHPKLYNLQVHFDEAYTIHLTEFSLVITHCNVTFSPFRLSQDSVATLIR